jgi:hypothetical protein
MSCDYYALAICQRPLQAGKTGTLTPLTTTALVEGPECHRPGSSAECVYLETCAAVEWDALEVRLSDVDC